MIALEGWGKLKKALRLEIPIYKDGD